MTRKSPEKRIHELDLTACQYALVLISKGVPFLIALKSAQKYQKAGKYQKEQEAQK